MHIIRHLDALPAAARGGAVAIGNFDGVHQGHLAIVRQLLQRAATVGGPAIVFTFDPHPVRLLRPEQCPPPLTWTERKAELLAAQGVDWIVAYPTDEALLQLSPADFFQRIVRDALSAKALVEGPNFYFGHNRQGNVERLGQLASAAGISLDVVPPVEWRGAVVSSSRVRDLISRGDIGQANELLSAPYRIRGMVTHGAGRGAKIGFPTANLGAIDTLLPAEGVYAGRARLAEASLAAASFAAASFAGANLSPASRVVLDPGYPSWPAAINLGPSPTFGDPTSRVEIHIVGLDEPLYGQPLEVDFWERLRDIRPFDSPAALVEQLTYDVEQVKKIYRAGDA
jgi:riboflavin kinase/FMN adenylyltransferase